MPFYIAIIGSSFIISILALRFKPNRKPILIAFSFFLLLSAAVEYAGWWSGLKEYDNRALYNVFAIVESIFYLFFFRTIFTSRKIKKILSVIISIYFLFALLNILFIQRQAFNSYTFILGSTPIVIFSIIYFYQLFRFPETGRLTRNPFFWIGIGLLFYYTCAMPLYGLTNSITQEMPYYSNLLYFIGDFLNVLLYTLFTIGFLCQINFRKLSGLL